MNINYKTTLSSLVFFLTLMSSNPTYSSEPNVSKLIGAWKVYKDDDTPNKKMPHEIMSFWKNGNFCIETSHPYKGKYVVKPTKLTLIIPHKGKTITINRIMNLKNNILELKNKKVGWVYYKKISNTPVQNCFG